ncbi:hypothetical protein G6M89_14660 [Natronolimnobius sp. AArcel1]|uniref:hypothetical protein n=1 Tax=Natronolimnobius sp. AArcel1 TaxID=1679093 RepID=UPI0013EB3C2D|nr:hypothetical protein [Natronolimnobius sp. AArcel1]NGM70236.1 hypothetical protein [Natronolimnobius sp. AArcel1]
MSEPDWAKILSYLYNSHSKVEIWHNNEIAQSDKVVSETGLDPQTIENNLDSMEDIGIVEMNFFDIDISTDSGKETTTGVSYSLTEKGFDIAHERKLVEQQDLTNRSLVAITVLLVGVTMIQAIAAVQSVEGAERTFTIIASILILISVGVGLWRSDFFK